MASEASTEPTGPGDLYRGRFAPSPTGPLHFGSLVAAIASYLQAVTHDGDWLLRIDDIDPPREAAGAADQIIAALAAHGFRWHGDIIYQSDNLERYAGAVAQLLEDGLAYACVCSREQIRSIAEYGPTGPVYPGTCRDLAIDPNGDQASAIRIRTAGTRVAFDDLIQGRIDCDVDNAIGDFIVRRKDRLIAYSLAAAVDDHDERISEVVRGADLLEFTPAHIFLQRALGLSQPTYCHVPVATHADGEKLSKQTGAIGLDPGQASRNLVRGLDFLAQEPPHDLAGGTVADVWDWAREHWRLDKLPRTRQRPFPN